MNIGRTNLTSLSGSSAQKPAVAPSSKTEAEPAPLSDRVDVTAAPEPAVAPPAQGIQHEKIMIIDGNAVVPTPVMSVPVSMLADDISFTRMEGTSMSGFAHPTSGLGVLAQLEEVRAVDEGGSDNRFAGLHLVGVHNAARFLEDPSGMYLGI